MIKKTKDMVSHPFGPLYSDQSKILILGSCNIVKICCNGRKSHEMYCKYIEPVTGREAISLPSTSSANAQWSLDRLTDAWAVELVL